jgi:hypothetical protein
MKSAPEKLAFRVPTLEVQQNDFKIFSDSSEQAVEVNFETSHFIVEFFF